MTQAPVFTTRRATWATLLNVAVGLLLSALTIANLVHQLRTDQAWGIAAMFLFLAVFFLWQAWSQFRDKSPLIEIGPEGVRLPSASADILPWSRVRHVAATRGMLGFRGGRIDFTVDAETFARLKLGQRFMGDVIVKARGLPNTFSLITPQLEENVDSIYAAVTRYRPTDRDENEEE